MSNWNLKDNLAIDNNKYLKFLGPTGLVTNNIIGLDTNGNLNLNSAISGDIYINSNTSTANNTFININNLGNTFIQSKLYLTSTLNINSIPTINLPKNSYIGLNTTTGTNSGFLGLVGGSSLLNTISSRILLFGIDNTSGNSGQINLFAGNSSTGNIQMYTANDSLKLQILNNGTSNFQPDGTTISLSVSKLNTTITNNVIITNTSLSNNASTGALIVAGGVGINGNTFINGALTINSISGNLNFTSSAVSVSYTSGSSYFVGGLGIQCSVSAVNQYNGGALSVAGGLALGQNAMIGGNITIFNSNSSTSALSGSGIFYGGLGVNGQINIRSDFNSQIKLTPITNGNETSILFGNQNNYTTTGSWTVGQNTNGLTLGNFSISNADTGNYITLNTTITLSKYTNVLNTMNFFNNTLNDFITFNSTQNTTNWSIGRVLNSVAGDFQISRYTNGNYLNHLLTADIKTGNIFILGTENSNSIISGGSLSVLGGASIQKDLYIGGNVYGGSITFNGSLQSNSSSDINVFSYLTLTATDNSINLTSGALVTFGGITIQASNDSVSTTNGGGLTIAGGASVYKSLYVGNTINCNTITSNFSIITNNTLSNIINQNLNNINITNQNLLTSNSSISNLIVNFQTIGNSNVTNVNIVNSTTSQLNVTNVTVNSIVITTGNLSIQTNSFLPLSISTLSINSSRVELDQNNNASRAIFGIDGVGYSNMELGALMISTFTNNPITFAVNNVRKMYLSTNGNLGINNTSPNFNIDITGTSRITGSLLAINNNNTLGNLFTTGGNIGINSTNPSNLLEVFNGRISTRSNNISAVIQTIFESTTVTQGTFLFTANDYKTYLYNQNISGTIGNNSTSLILQATSTNVSLGNVGIGTNNPVFTLDVSGTFRSSNSVSIQNTVNNISNTIGSINFSSDILLSNTTRNSILFNQAGVAPPTFNTRSIGTKLVLSPNISTNILDYAIGIDTNTMWFSSFTNFKWYLNSTTSNLQLTNTGLGINLTNNIAPSFALHVNGSTFITNGSFAATFNSNTLGSLFTTNGNVGINNTNPIVALDVIGSIKTSNSLIILGNSNTIGSLFTTNGNIGIQNTSPNKQLEISCINFTSNADNGLRISTKNYVSTSDPSYRYIDLRLRSDTTSNYRGSILGTLSGGIQTEFEYMSFSQDGFINIYSQTRYLSSVPCSNSSTASVILTGGLSINNFTNATSVSNGGALTVAGGASISGDLIVGGSILYSNAAAASSTFAYLTLTATDNSINIANGALVTFGGISIQCSTDAQSATQGNGMTIAGGLGVGASLYVGTNAYIPNITSTSHTTSNLLITNNFVSTLSNTLGNLYTTGGNIGINNKTPQFPLSITGTGAVLVITSGSTTSSVYQGFFSGNSEALIGIDGTGFGGFNTGAMLISSWTNNPLILGTNQIQRVFITTGGNVGINNTNPNSSLDITGVLNLRSTIDSINSSSGTLLCAGGISISKTTNSISVNNGGSLTIAGGAAIAKDIYVGGVVTSSSDFNLKENFRTIENVLDKIDSIKTIKYNTKNDISKIDYIGFIAQDFIEDFPELLKKENGEFYSLAYDRITVLNMACIKELKIQNKFLIEKINLLENKINSLI